jgi:Pentapeptide repeats (8 copies)
VPALPSSQQPASFAHADLTGADLNGADLTRADLTGANLDGVRNLVQEQLDKACGKPKVLPQGQTVDKPCPEKLGTPALSAGAGSGRSVAKEAGNGRVFRRDWHW